MPRSLIRFSCDCGKRLATTVKFAGRKTECPRCKQPITVPEKNSRPAPSRKPAVAAVASTGHPQLDSYALVLLKQFAEQIDEHQLADGEVTLRFLLPDQRRQTIRLSVEKDKHDRQWLLVSSEIGTVSTFDETATALRLNRRLTSGRLYLDDIQILQFEHRARLDEIDEARIVSAVDDVARWADEFEEKLFGIDVR